MIRSAFLSKTNIIIIIACAMIILGIFGARYSLLEKARQDIETTLTTTLNNTNKTYENWMTGQIVNIQQWPRDTRFSNHLTEILKVERSYDVLASHAEQKAIRDLVGGWLTDYGYQGYFIIAPDGTNLSSSRNSNLATVNLVKIQLPKVFEKILAGQAVVTRPLVNDIDVKGPTGRSAGTFATMFGMVPIFGDDGAVVAIFSVRLNPYGAFSAIFQGGRIGLTGETYLFDQSARMLSESRFIDDLKGTKLLDHYHGRDTHDGHLKVSEYYNAEDTPVVRETSESEANSEPQLKAEEEKSAINSSILNIEIKDPGVNTTQGLEALIPRYEQPLTLMAQSAIEGNGGINLDGYTDYRGVKVIGAWMWDEGRLVAMATEVEVGEAYGNVHAALNTLYLFSAICMAILLTALYASFWVRRRLDEVAMEVEENRRDLQVILDVAGEGIYGIDKNLKATFINQMACEILGYQEKELIGQNMHQKVHHSYPDGRHYPQSACQMANSIKTGGLQSFSDEVFWKKDGTPVPISYTVTPVMDDGTLTGGVVIFRDITKEIATKKTLERAKEGAVSANKAKSTFLSSMSHELRTPLNAILGFGQIMHNDPQNMSAIQSDYIGEMINAGTHLLNLINDVLELSKIEAGEMTLSLEKVHIEEVIVDCISMVSMLALRKGVDIIDASQGKKLPPIHSDFLRSKQILINLLSNAIKYNKKGGTVTIEAEHLADNFLRISVSDTGIGIDKSRHKELWRPFSRLGAETTNVEGSGIGLSLTKRVVKLLNGRIGMTSEVGTGSSFWFDLPLADADSKASRDKSICFTAIEENAEDFDFSDFMGLKIMLVEDAHSNQAVMASIFDETTGVDLLIADYAQKGLDEIESFKPDVILLDINLPDFDGFEFKRRLHDMPASKAIKVVALTANISKATREKAKALGFLDFLEKPIYIGDLYNCLKNLVNFEK